MRPQEMSVTLSEFGVVARVRWDGSETVNLTIVPPPGSNIYPYTAGITREGALVLAALLQAAAK